MSLQSQPSSGMQLPTSITGVVIATVPGIVNNSLCIQSTCKVLKYPVLAVFRNRRQVNKVIRALREGRDALYPKEGFETDAEPG